MYNWCLYTQTIGVHMELVGVTETKSTNMIPDSDQENTGPPCICKSSLSMATCDPRRPSCISLQGVSLSSTVISCPFMLALIQQTRSSQFLNTHLDFKTVNGIFCHHTYLMGEIVLLKRWDIWSTQGTLRPKTLFPNITQQISIAMLLFLFQAAASSPSTPARRP